MAGHYPGMPPQAGLPQAGPPHSGPPLGVFSTIQQPILTPDDYARMQQHYHKVSPESAIPPDLDEASKGLRPVSKGPKAKRRSSGNEQVKHRRTRSGCYTCRSRRVKCDEAHPTCERCRKGKRECLYPEPTTSSKFSRSSSQGKLAEDSASGSSGEELDWEEQERLSSIPDEEDENYKGRLDPATISSSPSQSLSQQTSNTSIGSKDRSPASATGESSAQARRPPARPRPPTKNVMSSSKWSHLPKDVRFYLRYHRDVLNTQHYAMKNDLGVWMKTTFFELALGYEPLLYAITAFSAYHHSLSIPNGKILLFLGYYNKSVSLLRQSLQKTGKHTVSTLLTILQLATFEEFLGDWVNLMGHQKAAYEIITELFTPQTIMQSETHRRIINWYMRLDLMAGLMSGTGTIISRDWFVACCDFYNQQARDMPNDLDTRVESEFADSRLRATDIAVLFGKKAKGALSDEDFLQELDSMDEQLRTTERQLTSMFQDTQRYVRDFPNAPAPDPDDIIHDATDPEFVFADELFTWNFILIDFWAIFLMFKAQVMQVKPQQQDPREMVGLAYKICKMFEALQYSSPHNAATELATQASLGVAAICLPRDQRHTMWCRRKYALIEAKGYIYPTALRKRMSDQWHVDVTRWWLPDDAGYPPIIRAIREFIEYRARAPHDAASEDLRDMKGLFSAMRIDDDAGEQGRLGGEGEDFLFDVDLAAFGVYDSSPDVQLT